MVTLTSGIPKDIVEGATARCKIAETAPNAKYPDAISVSKIETFEMDDWTIGAPLPAFLVPPTDASARRPWFAILAYIKDVSAIEKPGPTGPQSDSRTVEVVFKSASGALTKMNLALWANVANLDWVVGGVCLIDGVSTTRFFSTVTLQASSIATVIVDPPIKQVRDLKRAAKAFLKDDDDW